MKALFAILFCLFTCLEFAEAQDFVSTQPQLRNLVLEEFTGIHCGNCPGGHKEAKSLAEEYPGRVVLISIHEGSYAVPRTGEPDFRTQFGPAVLNQSSVTAFPCATVNRTVFPGEGDYPYWVQKKKGLAMSVNGWAAATKDSILNGAYSPLNIAAAPRWNNDTRTLDVDVEVYFTGDVPNDVKLNIALLESHVWGPQTGASDPNHYEHNHIFRDYLTGQWGETLTATAAGTLFKKTYSYHVKDAFVITNCDLALFATDHQNRNIYTGIDVPVIPPNVSFTWQNGRTVYTVSTATAENILELENVSDHQITFHIAMQEANITPAEWTAAIEYGFDVTIPSGRKVAKNFRVSPNGKHGVGDYYFTVSEPGNPISNAVTDSMRVATTDITRLEVNAGGTILDDARQARAEFISLPYDIFNGLQSRLNNLRTVVWNTGPTGGIDSTQASTIEAMIAGGTNVLLSGSGGIPLLALNYPNHTLLPALGISWSQMNEIPFTTFSLAGVAGDPVSDGFIAPGLSVTKNGYLMQRIDITDAAKTFPMLTMVQTGEVISVRSQSAAARAIYLGFNPLIIEDAAKRTGLIGKAIDWLEGTTGIESPAELAQSVDLHAAIHHLSGELVLQINSAKSYANATIGVYDIRGVLVQTLFSGRLDTPGMHLTAPFPHPRGAYFVRLAADGQQVVTGVR